MGFHQKRYSVNIPPFLLLATPHTVLPIIHRYGLWVISGALFLDSFWVIFMSGESILVAAGFLARYGALSIWLLIPMTVIAATLGNYRTYGLGSRFSHLIRLRWVFFSFTFPTLLEPFNYSMQYRNWCPAALQCTTHIAQTHLVRHPDRRQLRRRLLRPKRS